MIYWVTSIPSTAGNLGASTIQRADLDGGNAEDLVSGNRNPMDIGLDEGRRRIYVILRADTEPTVGVAPVSIVADVADVESLGITLLDDRLSASLRASICMALVASIWLLRKERAGWAGRLPAARATRVGGGGS